MASEIDRLCQKLNKANIRYRKEILNGGDHVFQYFDDGTLAFSAICSPYSYGGPEGLIELMLIGEPDVIGYLTAEECFAKIMDAMKGGEGHGE